MQNWLIVDEKYLDELRSKVEHRIPHSNYGADKIKPFFGVLFEKDDLLYVTQVSHAQSRHFSLKNSLDFKKLFIPESNPTLPDRFAAVVNLNFMFPIHKSLVINLDYKDINQYRTFASEVEKSKYIDLLKKELCAINNLNLEVAAKKIYHIKISTPDAMIAKRCFDFLALEKFASDYIK